MADDDQLDSPEKSENDRIMSLVDAGIPFNMQSSNIVMLHIISSFIIGTSFSSSFSSTSSSSSSSSPSSFSSLLFLLFSKTILHCSYRCIYVYCILYTVCI